MPKPIRLPDMGAEIEEVTITRWLVGVGDTIKEGDIILEVATDKVDTEIPATAGGVLGRIEVSEGELVPVNTVLGYLDGEGEETGSVAEVESMTEKTVITETVGQTQDAVNATPVARRIAAEQGVALDGVDGSGIGGRVTKKDVLAAIDGNGAVSGAALNGEMADAIDPVVKRLAAEEGIDLRILAGDGPLSAISKEDVLRAAGQTVKNRPRPVAPEVQPSSAAPTAAPTMKSIPTGELKPGEELIPHSRVRLLTARNTANAAQTIPHVTTWHDVNMAKVLAHRKAHKAEFATAGVKLTVTAYLIKAAVAGLKAVPEANSRWSDEGLILKHFYNIGMAVALSGGGLIVPVIRNVDDLSLMGVARQVNDMAMRGRDGKLKLDELQDGTFTVTNYGTSGSRFQTPIIAASQAGILGVGAIEKRAVVVSQGHPLEANTGDYLAFLPMLTLGFSYDHRILDGATADAVCVAIKQTLENWQ